MNGNDQKAKEAGDTACLSKSYSSFDLLNLIRKVYEADPLVCPRCEHPMRVIASIENPTVIRRILEHLGLWLANARSEPRGRSPPVQPVFSDAFFSQLPAFEEDDFSQLPPAHREC